MTADSYQHPDAIVTTEWLADHLDDPGLRIFECTMKLVYEPGSPVRSINQRDAFDAGHIPGAGYFDLQADLSDNESSFRFTMPPPAALATILAGRGVGDGTRVVLYSRDSLQWSTRVWWMLRAIGFDNAAVLDGGWSTWIAEGRPISTEGCAYGPETLNVKPRPALFVGPDAVQAAINDTAVCTINALTPDIHSGENLRYGRAGRIPGSVNISAAEMQDPETLKIPAAEDSAGRFIAVGADSAARIIVYCGGGIAASLDAFLLHQLGHEDIAIYDNSMTEWANDPARPMETD